MRGLNEYFYGELKKDGLMDGLMNVKPDTYMAPC